MWYATSPRSEHLTIKPAHEGGHRTLVARVTSGAVEALQRFYAAEAAYMQAGGASRGASFDAIAATLDPDVQLHQSPDLPWGGEFHGHDGYADWARQMADAFDQLEVSDERLFVTGDTVVSSCRLRTRSRTNGSTIDAPMTQVVTVKDGLIVDFRPYYWNVPDYQAAVDADHSSDDSSGAEAGK